jgi:hypothetical protein
LQQVMRALTVLVVLAMSRIAAAYPLVLPRKPAGELTRVEEAFRARNPQHWTAIDLDPRGFVRRAVTDDAGLVAMDVQGIRDLLRTNADLFGIDAADADRLGSNGSSNLLVAVDEVGMAHLVEIVVTRTDAALEIAVKFRTHITPKVSMDDVLARVLGKDYAVTAPDPLPSQIDCAMQSGGRANCKRQRPVRRRHRFTATVEDVRAVTSLFARGDRIRLVHCIDVEPDPRVSSPHPIGGAPALPLVVDAVTGAKVAGITRCDRIAIPR